MNLILTDFGYSTNYKSGRLFQTPVGTSIYKAPEILEIIPYDGKKAEIFSLGIILFIIVFGTFPFESASLSDKLYSLMLNGD